MMEDIEYTPIEEIKSEMEKQKNNAELATVSKDEAKSIAEIGLGDIKVKFDTNKSYTEQAEDAVGMMATAQAISDENTRDQLAQHKKEELVGKAKAKVEKTKEEVIEAETQVQKAEKDAYSGIMETFGFFKHLPSWLTKIIVYALTPFFILIGFIIGIPCGFVKILIDNIDGIICRYEKAENTSKPKIKVTVIVLFALAVLVSICLIILKCLHLI